MWILQIFVPQTLAIANLIIFQFLLPFHLCETKNCEHSDSPILHQLPSQTPHLNGNPPRFCSNVQPPRNGTSFLKIKASSWLSARFLRLLHYFSSFFLGGSLTYWNLLPRHTIPHWKIHRRWVYFWVWRIRNLSPSRRWNRWDCSCWCCSSLSKTGYFLEAYQCFLTIQWQCFQW